VLRHVDALGRLAHRAERGLEHGFGWAGERDHGAVRGAARIDVEQHRALGARDLSRDRVDHGSIASLAEVRDTLDQHRGPAFPVRS